MVVETTCNGMIATTHAKTSPPLDELQDCCGWPVLWNANARRLQQELAMRCPACVLFWLEDGQGLAATARLIAWLRERGARPYRVAAAYQLDDEAEAALRAAGAHSFLPIVDNVADTVNAALLPLFAESVHPTGKLAAKASANSPVRRPRRRVDVDIGLVRPP